MSTCTEADQQTKQTATEPIPPSDSTLQYRAIGLLWGKYTPDEGDTGKGLLLTSDGTSIEAVVLGKLLGLIKTRIDLQKEHLWIVYPRTREREKEPKLHVKLTGIWEPTTLHPDSPVPKLEQQPDHFSIRGEVVYQHKEEGWIMVKINQKSKEPSEKPSYFNLKLLGFLPEKPVKNFWNLHVEREGTNLVIQDGERIAYLGEKKPKKGKPKKGKKPHRSGTAKQSPPATTSPKEPPKLKKKIAE